MPCEGCSVQFTVFKRKRSCSNCRRYFCNHCLTKCNQNILCKRCALFARRPLTRADLMSFKTKDLLFYLQSKHISTKGYVEKEELVNLILTNTDVGFTPSSSSEKRNIRSSSAFVSATVTSTVTSSTTTTNNTTENCTNPFDQLRQTCQNFFNNITDRISTDLGFDIARQQSTSSAPSNSNYYYYNSQEIPIYAESINRNLTPMVNATSTRANNSEENIHRSTNISVNLNQTATTSTYNTNFLSPRSPTHDSTNLFSPNSPTPNTNLYSPSSPTPDNKNLYSPSSPTPDNISIYSPSSPTPDNISIYSPSSPTSDNKKLYSPSSPTSDNTNLFSPRSPTPDNIKLYSPSSPTSDNKKLYSPSSPTSDNTNLFSPRSPTPNDVFNSVSSPSSPLNSFSFTNNASLDNKNADNQRMFEKVTLSGNCSGCDCSDDEVITKYNAKQQQSNKSKPSSSFSPSSSSSLQRGRVTNKYSQISQNDSVFDDQMAGPSSAVAGSIKSSNENNQVKSSASSSESSFEELRAVGGSGGPINDNENWQMIDKVEIPSSSSYTERNFRNENWHRTSSTFHNNRSNDTFPSHSNASNLTNRLTESCSSSEQQEQQEEQRANHEKQRTSLYLVRRRSDSFICRPNFKEPEQLTSLQLENEYGSGDHSGRRSHKRIKKCCSKCGKSKKNIERQIEKFKRQLESSNLSANEVKRKLDEFIKYLEQRTVSIDCSDDSEETQANDDNNDNIEQQNRNEGNNAQNLEIDNTDVLHINQPAEEETTRMNFSDSNDGIRVYEFIDLTVDEKEEGFFKHDPRFINIYSFKSSDELDNLSVKQIKEILALNRVNYKGCCEKQELLDKVKRLWKELQSRPDPEQLSSNEICKVCMDAPIECVLLECGHMATCTNCGKVLNECPICRQFIVRTVRIFKA